MNDYVLGSAIVGGEAVGVDVPASPLKEAAVSVTLLGTAAVVVLALGREFVRAMRTR